MRRSLLAIAIAVVGAIALSGINPFDDDPTVPDIAVLGAKAASQPAPEPLAGAPGVLDAGVEGINAPDLARFGWRATGTREDRVGDRDVVTVSYTRGKQRLTYSVVSGEDHVDYGVPTVAAMRGPRGRKRELNFISGGPYLHGSEQEPAPSAITVTFKRRSRTVVLTTRRVSEREAKRLVRLALWDAGGRLAF